MSDTVTISQFRNKAGPLFSRAVQTRAPLFITRGSADLGVLLGVESVVAVLGDRQFSPEVMLGEGSASIWLPELLIYGQGTDYQSARADLLEEVREYVDEYLSNAEQYMRAPNRADHFPHVLKAHLADRRGELDEVVFPGPPASAPSAARDTHVVS